jgi:3-deoxy-D-manno-octulosonate 8-phosphate phosphatase KdsC-like HAD superfamily phosphatase
MLAAATLVTSRPGGRGAVREVVERLLRARGAWDAVVARYATAVTTVDGPHPHAPSAG